ncbi:MAG: glycosyltransferase [Nanoarchaeota archaeon]|nr:glycosyltransferase [Nanoarchaeota archaeon]
MFPEILFAASAALLFSVTAGYGFLVNVLSRNIKMERKFQTPKITVIIPTFNEEKFIGKKLENIFAQDYPRRKMEVIVSDASDDNTTDIAKKFPVKIIRAERGKINQINGALKIAKTDIVVLTDADVILDKSAIKNALSLLHGKVGAVNGFKKLLPRKDFYFNGKKSYHEKDWNLRYKEGLIDSCCGLDGELIAFRKSLAEKIPLDAYVDDFEMTFMIRKKGFRCVVDIEAIFYENPASGLKEEIKQMRRRTMHSIFTVFGHLDFLFNGKFGFFGLATLPFRRFLIFFAPFLLAYVLVYLYLFSPALAAALLLAYGIAVSVSKKVFYNSVMLLSIALAWLDIALGRTKKGARWEKNKR